MPRTREAKFDASRMQSDMDSLGWMNIDLARLAGVSHTSVGRFLSGERQTPRMAKKLAVALGFKIDRYIKQRRRAA